MGTENELAAIERDVALEGEDGDGRVAVRLARTYDGSAAEVWSALTDPERLRRWFLPVTGDLREGGEFATEGNASGRILTCDPPHRLVVTWGDAASIVTVTVTPDSASTATLRMEHTVPLAIAQSGAGALFVGPGWDQAFAGLAAYLRGQAPSDPVAAEASLAGQLFVKESTALWAAAVERSGTASADETAAMTEMSLAQMAPDA